MIRNFMDGGTDTALALRASVEKVGQLAAKGDKGADLILATDGVDFGHGAQLAALDAAAKLGIRLWTVAIECDIAPADPLRARAASYVRLGASDLSDGRSAVALGAAA